MEKRAGLLRTAISLFAGVFLFLACAAAEGTENTAISADPRDSSRYTEANTLAEGGYEYLTTGRYIEAIVAFQKAADLAPHAAFLYYDLGIAYYNLNQYEQALAYYDKALSLRANYANALVNRAKTLDKLGRPDDALASYNKAVDIEPNADDIRIHRGYFYASQGNHEKAIEEYRAGVRLKPENGQGHYWLAQSYAKTGKPAEAWEEVHAAQKAGYPVDANFLKDLKFQIPEPLDTKPASVRAPGEGPIVTQAVLKQAREDMGIP